VQWLVDAGVPFSPDPDGPLGLHLTREGGHAVRRIAHAADATGRPSTTRCWRAPRRTRTSRCASAGWRWT
jgi:aspartate oxidase